MTKKTNSRVELLVALASLRSTQEVFYLDVDRRDDSALLVHLNSNARTESHIDVAAVIHEVKQKKSGLSVLENADHLYVVADDNRKKLSKALGLDGKKLPTGSVAFPADRFVLLDARGDSYKERDKFLGKIMSHIPDADKKLFEFSDGSIGYRKEGAFMLVPALDLNDLALVWAVTMNKRGNKWAFVFNTFTDALDRLKELAETPAAAKAA